MPTINSFDYPKDEETDVKRKKRINSKPSNTFTIDAKYVQLKLTNLLKSKIEYSKFVL